jgi:hypothetical protein
MVEGNAQNMDFAMTAPLKTVEGSDIATLMHDIGRQATSASLPWPTGSTWCARSPIRSGR